MTEPDSFVFNRNNPVTKSVDRHQHNGVDLVRKVIQSAGPVVVDHWVAGHEDRHWNLWNREDLVYSSGLVDLFAPWGLRAPKLLDRVERVDQANEGDVSVELFLEQVDGRTAAGMVLNDHERINRRLGQAQGVIGNGAMAQGAAAGGVQPNYPWLSKKWLRQYALSRPGLDVYDDPQRWEHPVVVEGFGAERRRIRREFGKLLNESDRWLNLMERLPRTICHLDFWPNNAIAANDGTDVLIDWGFVGDGAVGEDPGNWVPDTFFDHFMEPHLFDQLDSLVWSAYADGLEAAGWSQPVELARLAMCASAVKYVWLPGLMVLTADHAGPTGYGGQAGYPLPEVFERRAVIFDRLLAWVDEAKRLAATTRVEF